MKKYIGIGLMVLTAILLLTSASRPSLDGRAVVAEEGVLPSGMFAKSVGYLPGDSVVVTNPATGMSVDVMILGSISSSEGVAIMLSPEAAAKIFISKGSNIQVKVTKKTSSYDEPSSVGILPVTDAKTKSADPDKVPEEAIPEEIVSTIEDQANLEAETETAMLPSDEKTTEEVPVEETPVDEAPIIAETEEPVVDETPVDEAPIIAETEESADTETPIIAESEESVVEEPVEEAPIIAESEEPVVEETPVDEAPIIAEAEEPAVEEAPIIAETEESAVEEAPIIAETEEPVVDETPIIAEIPSDEKTTEEVPVEETPVDEAPIIAETEDSVVEETPVDEYAPIVLVPAETNPPKSVIEEPVPEVAYIDSKSLEEVKSDEEVAEVVEVPPVAKAAVEDKELSPIILEVSPINSEEKNSLTFTDTTEMVKNAFYIQIAVYKEEANVEKLKSKYGEKYPLSFVKLVDNRIQVLVGPLSVDEYETVMLRFRKNGFKDAFVRKF